MSQVHLVHLKVYGFPHPGRERWRSRVIKRPWRVIPGSTLYGVLTAALIKMDCEDGYLNQDSPEGTHECQDCSYGRLLGLIGGERPDLRFSPLVQVGVLGRNEVNRNKIHELLVRYLTPIGEDAASIRADLYTEPHAPLNRDRLVIHGDRLYGFAGHQPFRDYGGFIVERADDDSILPTLKRGLRALPLMPFGGRGKFCTVEGRIVGDPVSEDEFLQPFKDKVGGGRLSLRLLTPMILSEETSILDNGNASEWVIPRLQLYRAWRQGMYRDGGELVMFPREKEHGNPNDDVITDTQYQARATMGVPEDSTFNVDGDDEFWDDFLWGFGNRDWTYLGWGQVIIDG